MAEAEKTNDKELISKIFNSGLVLLAVSVTISISLMTAATGILLLVFLIKLFKKELSFMKTGLELPLLIFILLYAFSSLLSFRPLTSLDSLSNNYWYILNFYIVVYLFNKDNIWKFLKVLAGASVVMGIYALVQSLTGWPLLGGLSGDILAIEMGDKVMEKVTNFMGLQIYMGTGVLSHHLTFGGQIMMLTFISYAVLKKKWKTLFAAGGLLVSFAYSAWLGFAAGVAGYLLFNKKRVKYAAAFVLLAGILLVAVPGNLDKIRGKLEGRIDIWNVSWDIYTTSPVFGIGIGEYTRVFKEDYQQNYTGVKSGSTTHPHSIYLSMLVGGGLLTFLAFLYFIYIFIKKYGSPPDNLKDDRGRFLYRMLWASLAAIAAAGFFQTYLTDAENSVLIWTIAGIIVKLNLIYSEKNI